MAQPCVDCGSPIGGLFGSPASNKDPSRCQLCAWKNEEKPKLDPEAAAEAERARVEQARATELKLELESKSEELAKGVAISTTSEIVGRDIISHIGIARGGTVRAKNAISDIGAGIKNMVGGELKGYTQLLADAREQAIHRMQVDAVLMGANAVIGVNFSTSMIDVGAAEISAFGTAVRLSEVDTDE